VEDVRLAVLECRTAYFFRNFLHTTCLTPFLKAERMIKAPGNAMLVSCCLIIDNGLQALFVLLAVLVSN